ncbi:hypothetical protein [uncultured Winogradskyella sp.]|uniref:hypothetical protein n=1 Tax=uncultured Winogradskyella sp. TaxID=395353 RepID=UPI0030DD9C7F
MKIGYVLLLVFCITSCSSVKLNERWRNPKTKDFKPKNILIIGVNQDFNARKTFEFKLKNELNKRGINALQSHVVFREMFQATDQTEQEVKQQELKLIEAGYDCILIALVKGIDENQSYSGGSAKVDYSLRKFIGYYLAYRDNYLEQNYQKKYKVVTVETLLYSLKRDAKKRLVWSGSFDLVDPKNTDKVTDNYIKRLLKTLQRENLINRY